MTSYPSDIGRYRRRGRQLGFSSLVPGTKLRRLRFMAMERGGPVEGPIVAAQCDGVDSMKVNKQTDPAAAGSDPIEKREQDETTAREARMPAAGGGPRKARGRLNRATLSRLGKALDAYFEIVRKEGVPERFRRLLDGHDMHQPLQLQNGGATDKGHSL